MLPKSSLLQIYLFLVIFGHSWQLPNRRFDYKLQSFTCTPVKKAMSKFECGFKRLAENDFLLFARVMFSKNMTNLLNFHLFVDITPRSRTDIIHFISVKVKGCEALRTANGHHLLERILKEVRRKLNIPFKCPFKVNFLYELKNYSMTDDFIPPFTPFMNFTFGLDYYDSKTLVGTTRAFGEVVPKVQKIKQ